ncbi:hypothetical protein DFP73DRAFT_594286 [Morchella snyderi]|nr:hypothetical protein DFP73DRAFT_594286 [Morchella snyderi]
MAPGKKDKLAALKAMQAELAQKARLLEEELHQLATEEENDGDSADGGDHSVNDEDNEGEDIVDDDDTAALQGSVQSLVTSQLPSQMLRQVSHRFNHAIRKAALPLIPQSISAASPEDVGHSPDLGTKKRVTEEVSPTERYLGHKRSKNTVHAVKNSQPLTQLEPGPSKKVAKRHILPRTPVTKPRSPVQKAHTKSQQSQALSSQQHDISYSGDEAKYDDDNVINCDEDNESIKQYNGQDTHSEKKAKATDTGSHSKLTPSAKSTKSSMTKAGNDPGTNNKFLSRDDLNKRMGIYAGGVDLKTANQIKRLRRQWVLEECIRKGLDLRAPFHSYSYQNKMYPAIKHITSLAPPEWGWDRDVTKDVIHTLCQDRVRSMNRRTDGLKGKPRGPQAVSRSKAKSKVIVELSDAEESVAATATTKTTTTKNIPRLFVPDASMADKSSPPVSNTSAANTPRADTIRGKANSKIPIKVTASQVPSVSKTQPPIPKKNPPNKLASKKRSNIKNISDIPKEPQVQATPLQEQVDDTFQAKILGEIHTFAKDIEYQEFDEIVGNYLVAEKDEMRYYRASYGTGRAREWKPLNYPDEFTTAVERYGDVGIELMIKANAEEFASGGEEPNSHVIPINKLKIAPASRRVGNNLMTKYKVATHNAKEDPVPKDSQPAATSTDITPMEISGGATTGNYADIDIVLTDALITPPNSQAAPELEKGKPESLKKTDTAGGDISAPKRKRGRPPGSGAKKGSQIGKQKPGEESQSNLEATKNNGVGIGDDDEEACTQTRRSRRRITKSRRVQDNEEYGKEVAYANELMNAKKNLKRDWAEFEQRYPPAYLKWLPSQHS